MVGTTGNTEEPNDLLTLARNEGAKMAYSVDLRERMLANLDDESMRRTAKRFRMSLSSVYRIKRRYEETGQLQAKKSRGRLPAIDARSARPG